METFHTLYIDKVRDVNHLSGSFQYACLKVHVFLNGLDHEHYKCLMHEMFPYAFLNGFLS